MYIGMYNRERPHNVIGNAEATHTTAKFDPKYFGSVMITHPRNTITTKEGGRD